MIRKTIKAAMKSHEVTYRELAEAIGVRKATISDYLNGKSEMTSANLEKIFEYLEIKTEFLMSYKENYEYKRVKWLCIDGYNSIKDKLIKNPTFLYGYKSTIIKNIEYSDRAYQEVERALIECLDIFKKDGFKGYVIVSEDDRAYRFELDASLETDAKINSTKDFVVLYT